MDSMTFGKYIPVNSLIHRLDPRLKIGALLIFLIATYSVILVFISSSP